jgi:alginate O-acetyltransferase complex protein AlgI
MLFSSALVVFQFLPLVLLGLLLPWVRARNAVLLIASLVFYAWGEQVMVGLMLLSALVNWGLGLWVARAVSAGRGRGVVVLAVVFNLGLLLIFKYADWIWDSLGIGLTALGWIDRPMPSLLRLAQPNPFWSGVLSNSDGGLRLPIGISFFTFQALSYVIDVFRRDTPAQKNPFDFALYLALFPQLIAGPIVRYRDIAAQLRARTIDLPGFSIGVRRFVIGLGKKMLLANPVASLADSAFAVPPEELSTSLAWLGILAYTLQIYFDFSGYSDMAIGLGRMFGFRLLENFEHPYVARSITEFWRRWHISLSSWFRDYLYVPLGGNRKGRARTYANLVLVFLLCGLWHGASSSFVFWGLFHGAFLVLERSGLSRWLERRSGFVRHAYLLLVVMVGWVFFRAADLEAAVSYLGAMFGMGAPLALEPLGLHVNPRIALALMAGALGSMPWVSALSAWSTRRAVAGKSRVWIALEAGGFLALALVFFLCSLELAGKAYNPFIYFRF